MTLEGALGAIGPWDSQALATVVAMTAVAKLFILLWFAKYYYY